MKPIAQTQIQAFAHALLQNEKSAATQEKYIRAVEKLSVFLGGKDVTKAGVLEYRTFLLERLSAQTVNGYLSAVNAFLEFCGCPENRVKLLKVQRRLFLDETRELSRQEYARLVRAAQKKRDPAEQARATHFHPEYHYCSPFVSRKTFRIIFGNKRFCPPSFYSCIPVGFICGILPFCQTIFHLIALARTVLNNIYHLAPNCEPRSVT